MPSRTPRSGGAGRAPLTRAAVVEAALAMADEEGMETLSMRRLAARLGVEAMSLYNHVGDKRDLVEAVVNLVLARIPMPDTSLGWRARLQTMAIGLYETLIRHPAVVLALLREEARPVDPAVLARFDAAVAALAESGLPPPAQVRAFRSIMAMCFGFVLAHTQGLSRTRAEAETLWAQWDSTQYDSADVEHLARLAPHFLSTRPDGDLEVALDAYLETLERSLSK
jgi:AcrR family transcriptional regulator